MHIHWFRKDLRLSDNPALLDACKGGQAIAIFVLDESGHHRRLGGASRWWLHFSLSKLAEDLRKINVSFILKRGNAAEIIPSIAARTKAAAVTANRRYEKSHRKEETIIAQLLNKNGQELKLLNGNLLHDPLTHRNNQGKPYQVYTPFWRSLAAQGDPAKPAMAPKKLSAPPDIDLSSDELKDWKLLPTKPDWAKIIAKTWNPGEESAIDSLDHFLKNNLNGYKENRNYPGKTGTSRLSPHLHWGEISPRQIWHRTMAHCHANGQNHFSGDAEVFLKEVCWREFSYHLLTHWPDMPTKPLRAQFEKFPWKDNGKLLRDWQLGQTGYPIVDAGMRELWQTGWMHNRVRMIAASFLIKHLLINWEHGETWFWDTLVDADAANNAASWQWVAGCGADAAPYFRIFNPVLQGEKFDADGNYVRQYVPELSKLPNEYIHKPWAAPPLLLAESGVVLGKTYPHPMVDHDKARKAALAALAELKE
ncbi:MAG: deoxyribodipyrimidine photo-lyase [Alphaproteobacteria bacterium]|nr:MAG: deoxyribodipyrimidine photo-lyase [Alphaproteobacteria bacterium]